MLRYLLDLIPRNLSSVPSGLLKSIHFISAFLSLSLFISRRPGLLAISTLFNSKTKPAADIQVLYDHGHRLFGENYVQVDAYIIYGPLPIDITAGL